MGFRKFLFFCEFCRFFIFFGTVCEYGVFRIYVVYLNVNFVLWLKWIGDLIFNDILILYFIRILF